MASNYDNRKINHDVHRTAYPVVGMPEYSVTSQSTQDTILRKNHFTNQTLKYVDDKHLPKGGNTKKLLEKFSKESVTHQTHRNQGVHYRINPVTAVPEMRESVFLNNSMKQRYVNHPWEGKGTKQTAHTETFCEEMKPPGSTLYKEQEHETDRPTENPCSSEKRNMDSFSMQQISGIQPHFTGTAQSENKRQQGNASAPKNYLILSKPKKNYAKPTGNVTAGLHQLSQPQHPDKGTAHSETVTGKNSQKQRTEPLNLPNIGNNKAYRSKEDETRRKSGNLAQITIQHQQMGDFTRSFSNFPQQRKSTRDLRYSNEPKYGNYHGFENKSDDIGESSGKMSDTRQSAGNPYNLEQLNLQTAGLHQRSEPQHPDKGTAHTETVTGKNSQKQRTEPLNLPNIGNNLAYRSKEHETRQTTGNLTQTEIHHQQMGDSMKSFSNLSEQSKSTRDLRYSNEPKYGNYHGFENKRSKIGESSGKMSDTRQSTGNLYIPEQLNLQTAGLHQRSEPQHPDKGTAHTETVTGKNSQKQRTEPLNHPNIGNNQAYRSKEHETRQMTGNFFSDDKQNMNSLSKQQNSGIQPYFKGTAPSENQRQQGKGSSTKNYLNLSKPKKNYAQNILNEEPDSHTMSIERSDREASSGNQQSFRRAGSLLPNHRRKPKNHDEAQNYEGNFPTENPMASRKKQKEINPVSSNLKDRKQTEEKDAVYKDDQPSYPRTRDKHVQTDYDIATIIRQYQSEICMLQEKLASANNKLIRLQDDYVPRVTYC